MMASLKQYNTFGLDGYARKIVCANSPEELLKAWQEAAASRQPALILGEGSNILLIEDFNGTVILNRIKGITVEEQTNDWLLHVGAGENWHQLVKYTLENNIPGMENLALIPGCVGSAPIQNIGAYGVEFKQICHYVDCIVLPSGKFQRLSNSECKFAYRDSIFKQEYKNNYAITGIGLVLPKSWTPTLDYGELAVLQKSPVTPHQVFEAVCSMRLKKLPDPYKTGNAGSFFKNPIIDVEEANKLLIEYPNAPRYYQRDSRVKLAAGWLIDQCGLKGFKIGGAAVHKDQALVIINEDKATSQDIVCLAKHVRKTVGKKFNIWLEPEVRFIGKSGEVDPIEVIA